MLLPLVTAVVIPDVFLTIFLTDMHIPGHLVTHMSNFCAYVGFGLPTTNPGDDTFWNIAYNVN